MKMEIPNPAARFLALSAIALTLSSAPSRADWTTVRPDGTVVTVSSSAASKGQSGPDGVAGDDYAHDSYDGPSASGRKKASQVVEKGQSGRSGRGVRHGVVPSVRRGRSDTSINVYPGYVTPGYGYAVPGYGVPSYGVPSYGVPGYGTGSVTIIQTPQVVAPAVQFPGFPPLPGTQTAPTYVYPPPTVIQSYPAYPGYPAHGYPSGYPAYGYPSYGYPNGTTTYSYGGLSVSRGGFSVGIGGSRTTTQSTWGTGIYR